MIIVLAIAVVLLVLVLAIALYTARVEQRATVEWLREHEARFAEIKRRMDLANASTWDRLTSAERSIVALTKDTEAHVKSATGHVRASQEIANRLLAIELQIKDQRHS